MQWWCAAQGVPWEWSWRPYPGVWAFVLLLAAGYWLALRRLSRGSASRAAPSGDAGAGRDRIGSFAAGLLLLWIALDWPVGALGAGYLASLHMVQFLLIALASPPLLLYGIPPALLRRLVSRRAVGRMLEAVTHPVAAFLAFNATVVATHWPAAVDGLMVTQAGSFLLDMAWLAGGSILWWPVVCPVPERPRFGYPFKIGYLILNTVAATAPYAFLTFSELPFYAVYELAPPVGGISARTDQRLAGILMKLGGGAVLWTAIGVLFFRWYASETVAPAGRRTPGARS